MLDREKFRESLHGQFKESIQMAIHESYSQYNNNLDIKMLDDKLKNLQRFASRAGIKPDQWVSFILELSPSAYKSYYTEVVAA
jgi:membrane-bound lytic murein transglycosylase MltF